MSQGPQREAASGIQVITRAAAILRTIRDQNSGMSLGQIAEKIDLPRSTVQRIVFALENEQLLISSASGGGIRLGPELLSLGAATHYNMVDQCRPHLEDLMRRTGETVELSILSGGHMICLDQVQGGERLRAVSSVGDKLPVTATANGRACLAKVDPDQAEMLARKEWKELGIKENWTTLKKQLIEIRKSGIAFDLNDHTKGISAAGFAFVDATQDLHAVSVSVPSSRYEDKSKLVIEALRELQVSVQRDLTLSV